MYKVYFSFILMLMIAGCSPEQASESVVESQDVQADAQTEMSVKDGIDPNSALYEVEVQEGISHEDVVDSLKSVAEGMNFANAHNFHIDESIKNRDIDPQGVKEVYTYCNLTLGMDILLDHPEFLVFAPCRIAIYEKPDANNKMKLYLGLDRPTYDLKSIKNPSERAVKSAQALEDALIEIMHRASVGDF